MFQVIEIVQAQGIRKYFLTGLKEHTVHACPLNMLICSYLFFLCKLFGKVAAIKCMSVDLQMFKKNINFKYFLFCVENLLSSNITERVTHQVCESAQDLVQT